MVCWILANKNVETLTGHAARSVNNFTSDRHGHFCREKLTRTLYRLDDPILCFCNHGNICVMQRNSGDNLCEAQCLCVSVVLHFSPLRFHPIRY